MDGKVPKPNVVYEAGEHRYLYRTDEVGRIDRAYAEDLQLKLHEDRLRHNSNTLDKEIGDHAYSEICLVDHLSCITLFHKLKMSI